jgi:hypothetical protein
MNRTTRIAPHISPILIGALVCALTSCSSSNTGAASSLSLIETKSPTQLLRNVAAGFLDSKLVANVTNTEDESLSCGNDPNIRAWNSSVTAGLDVEHQSETEPQAKVVIAGLVDNGWSPEIEEYTDGLSVRLTRTGSVSVIHIKAMPAVVGYKGHGAQVKIRVTGPCVKTDGPDSSEVKTLEGRS